MKVPCKETISAKPRWFSGSCFPPITRPGTVLPITLKAPRGGTVLSRYRRSPSSKLTAAENKEAAK